MVTRLLGRKLGMTQIFDERGLCYGVTVIEAGPCKVEQVKTEARDGYNALQIGFGVRKVKNLSRARVGHLVPRGEKKDPKDRKKQIDQERKRLQPPEVLREIPWDGKEEIKVGDTLTCSLFAEMKRVDVVGVSKGRGWTSAIQRWRFHRQPATHGASDRERAPGSLIGGVCGGYAGKVALGKKMAGHWGAERVTQKNLPVVKVDPEKNLVFLHGAVPGPENGIVLVQESHWVAPRASTVVAARKK